MTAAAPATARRTDLAATISVAVALRAIAETETDPAAAISAAVATAVTATGVRETKIAAPISTAVGMTMTAISATETVEIGTWTVIGRNGIR